VIVSTAARGPSNPPWAKAVTAAVFTLALLGCGVFVYSNVFSRFMFFDDEGYLMITRDRFLAGLRLYDEVYSQYGPFYYLHYSILHGLIGVPLTHDANRLITSAHWLLGSVLISFCTFKLTKSRALTLAVFCQAVFHEYLLSCEPGHPQEVVFVLIAALALAFLYCESGENSRYPWFAAGSIIGLTACTKINIGVLALLAFAAAMSIALRATKFAWLGKFTLAVLLAFPAVLMREHAFSTGWGFRYWFIVTCSLASVFIMGWNLPVHRPRLNSAAAALAGVVAAIALCIAFALAKGTSMHALVDVLWTRPLAFASTYTVPANPISKYGMVASVAGLALALAFSWLSSHSSAQQSRYYQALDCLKLALVVVFFALALNRSYERLLAYFSPFLWLLLVQQKSSENDARYYARILLAFLAAFQTMHSYPVFGTHLTLATVLMLPIFAVILSDSTKNLFGGHVPRFRPLLHTAALAAILVSYVFWMNVYGEFRGYRQGTPLDLPGAKHVRLDPKTVKELHWMTSKLKANADTFISMPGMNSLYFWTGLRPPTSFNAGSWMFLLNDSEQLAVVDALRRYDRACAIYSESGVDFWLGGRPMRDTPLVTYIHEEFVPIETQGRYTYMERKPNPPLGTPH
jgi:hypothetical protein